MHIPVESTIDEQLVRRIRQSISDVTFRVNQLILLQHLHETRVCSRLLVPAAKTDEDVEDVPSGHVPPGHTTATTTHAEQLHVHSQEQRTSVSKRQLVTEKADGHFACTEQYTMRWLLHGRVDSQVLVINMQDADH